MRRMFIMMAFLAAGTFLAAGCTSQKAEMPAWPWQEEEEPAPEPEPEPEGEWSDVSSDYDDLPSYIRVMKSPSVLQGKPAAAFVAIADMSKASLDLWCINDPKLEGCDERFKTPSKVYEETSAAIITNGGYFYADWSAPKFYSMSLAVRQGQILSQNVNYASEDWKTIYYPTRAALLLGKDGKAYSCWTYFSNADGKTYVYPQPAENSWKSKPLQTPSATFPEGASELDAQWGIGGGPVLLKDGKVVNSYEAELFLSDVGCTANNPRTAAGVTADGHLVLFVCEGRNMTEGVAGFTTAEVAEIMKDLGCVDAINLDGGGSSCMLVCGKETIKVSDGEQRPVACTIMLK